MGILDFLGFELAEWSNSVEQKCSSFRIYTVPKIKFSIKDFFRKSDQIRNLLRISSQLL